MGVLDLTVQLLNIPPEATEKDVTIFFSYCGTVDEVQVLRNGDQTQMAYVTFKQPYAFQTALLLNDAILLDRRVRVLPMRDALRLPLRSNDQCSTNSEVQKTCRGIIPEPQAALQAMALKGQDVLNTANSAISSAEQAVGNIGTAIISSSCFSKSALWLSGVLDRASKTMAELGSVKAQNTNRRKQK